MNITLSDFAGILANGARWFPKSEKALMDLPFANATPEVPALYCNVIRIRQETRRFMSVDDGFFVLLFKP